MRLNNFPWWIGLLILCLVGCAGPTSKPTPQPGAAASEKTGLRFRLSAADSASDARQAYPLAQATPLPASEIEALVRRLPSLQSRAGDKQAFALRPGSQPPPRTAKKIQQPFPPPTSSGPPPAAPDQPLEITAIAPRGQVEMAPHLTVSFNQPMVPISTVDSLAQQEVPAKLTPQPPGQWRWLGTQTLIFVPDLRFPMATQYQVTIPAGVASASGVKLAAPQIETFRPPPPLLTQSYPNDKSQTLRPIILLAFNQDVDPKVVASKVKLTGARLRLANPAEVAEDDTIHGLAQAEGKDRWVALVPEQDLRPGQSYIGPDEMALVERGLQIRSHEEGRLVTLAESLIEYFGGIVSQARWGKLDVDRALREAALDLAAQAEECPARDVDDWSLSVAAAPAEVPDNDQIQVIKKDKPHWENPLLRYNAESRLPTPAQRLELLRRDGYKCQCPGCPNHLWLETHHIVFYRDGGQTVPENLLIICRKCHQNLHRGYLRIEGSRAEGLRFLDREGRDLAHQVELQRAIWIDGNLGWKGGEFDSHYHLARLLGSARGH